MFYIFFNVLLAIAMYGIYVNLLRKKLGHVGYWKQKVNIVLSILTMEPELDLEGIISIAEISKSGNNVPIQSC